MNTNGTERHHESYEIQCSFKKQFLTSSFPPPNNVYFKIIRSIVIRLFAQCVPIQIKLCKYQRFALFHRAMMPRFHLRRIWYCTKCMYAECAYCIFFTF